jgi:hypothetical protein
VARKSRNAKTPNGRARKSRTLRGSRDSAKAIAKKARKAAESEDQKRALEEIDKRWDPDLRIAALYDSTGDDEFRYLRNECAIRNETRTFEIQGIEPADDTQYLLCKYGLPEGPMQSCIAIGEILLPSESPVRPNRLRYHNMDCRGIPGACGNQVCPRAKPQFRQPLLKKIEPKFRELGIIKPDQVLLWKGRGSGIENLCQFPEDLNCPVCMACRAIINGRSETVPDDRLVTVAEVSEAVKRASKTIYKRVKEWGEPDEPGRGSHPHRWRLARLKPILKGQFPHASRWIDEFR